MSRGIVNVSHAPIATLHWLDSVSLLVMRSHTVLNALVSSLPRGALLAPSPSQVLEAPDSSLSKTATGIMIVSSVLLARHLWLDEGSSLMLMTSSAQNVPSRS